MVNNNLLIVNVKIRINITIFRVISMLQKLLKKNFISVVKFKGFYDKIIKDDFE